MANIKITDLVTLTEPVSTDVLPIVDVSLDVTKKISIAELLRTAGLGSQTDPGISFDGDTDTGVYSPGANQLAFTTNGSEALRIDANGNVGIGTTDPDGLLDVFNTNNVDVYFGKATDSIYIKQLSTVTGIQFGSNRTGSTGGNRILQFDRSSGLFQFLLGSNGSESPVVTINGSGNVGIGTSSPSSILHVKGVASGSNIRIEGNASTNYTFLQAINPSGVEVQLAANGTDSARLLTASNHPLDLFTNGTRAVRIDTSQRVGIGTTSPAKLLDVNGDALINGMTVGIGAGNYPSNTAIGNNSFVSNTTGLFNIAIGQNSLQANTEGDSNTGVGQGTLVDNTTGSNNTALGQLSLNANTEGDANTAVGRNALVSNITGSLNTAVGRNAGRYIEGSNNTVLGAYQGTTADATLNDTVIISAGPTERLRIDSDGNVGIGTTVPDELLHIEGDAAEFKGTNTNSIDVSAGTEQVFKFGIEGQKNNVYGPAGSIIFRQDGTWSSVEPNFKPTRIELCTQDTTTTDNSETPRLVINNAGNVGIGVTAPQAALDINAAASTSPFIASINSSEAARIDSSGRLLVGISTATDVAGNFGSTSGSNIQVVANSSFAAYSAISKKNDTSGPLLALASSRSDAIVQADDRLGEIRFAGYDGTDYQTNAALIKVEVDGTPGANDMPGRLVFATTADGASSPTVRMVIKSSGNVGIGTSSPGALLDVNGSFSKNSGSFKIDHPLPALTKTHHLVHSFVEAPDASNLYAGMVQLSNGVAVVNIDIAHRMTEGTFEALNNPQSWSSSNESGYAPVKSSLSGNLLTIECQDQTSSDTVYYEVRGIRKDQHMIETEWTDESGRVITEPLKQGLADAGL